MLVNNMFIPIEIRYHIYDYAYGTPTQGYNKVVLQLRQLRDQFTNRSYINNMIAAFYPELAIIRQNWNNLWYTYLYKHFFAPVPAKRLRDSNINVGTIHRIFINFERYGYLNNSLVINLSQF